MALWPWTRETKETVEEVETKASTYALGLSDELGAFLMFGENSATTPGSALRLYEQSSAVSVPVSMIANPFSIIDPVLTVDKKVIPEHPVLDLLKKPSPYYSQELFLEVMARNFLVTGEAVVVALGGVDRPPLELQPLSPAVVSPVEGPGGVASSFGVAGNTVTGQYVAARKGPRVRYFDGELREFKQIRNYSTKNNSLLRGQSPLVSAAKEARQQVLGTEHNTSLLNNGGRVSLVFHFKQNMSEEDYRETTKRIREQFGGAEAAGSIMITTGDDLSIQEAGVTNKDMDFANLQLLAQKFVALAFGVPLALVTNERQTFNNYREAKLALYDDAVIPLAKRLFGGLGNFLLPRYDLDPSRAKITLDPDGITALVMRRTEELIKRKSIGVETDNEIRALMGREPYENGDVVLKPANLIPAGSDVFTADNAPEILEDPEAN